jgi:Flp pilus assembly protein TadG
MVSDKRGAEIAEAAVALPVVILVLFFVINGMLAGYTAMVAAAAANEGARAGSTARTNPEQWASAAIEDAIKRYNGAGTFTFSVNADEEPGGAVTVMVAWSYPSILSGLCNYFRGICPKYFGGVTTVTRKREGW